jgi:hypothetical protein
MNHIAQRNFDCKKETYLPHEIFPLLINNKGETTKKLIDGDMIKVSSIRLLTFKTHGI